jgi:predicted amidophosphoribosyltransferase
MIKATIIFLNRITLTMIFNCISCGKAVSSLRDVCPYCKTDITEINEKLNQPQKDDFFKSKIKGTILALVQR